MDLLGDWHQSEGISCAGWDVWIGYRQTKPKYTWATLWRRADDIGAPYKVGKIHVSHDAALAAIKEIRTAFHQANYEVVAELVNPDAELALLPEYGAF